MEGECCKMGKDTLGTGRKEEEEEVLPRLANFRQSGEFKGKPCWSEFGQRSFSA